MKWVIGVLFLIVPLLQGEALADTERDLAKTAQRQTEMIQQGGKDWPIISTQYFRIRHQPGLVPDPVACQELDRFLEKTLVDLDATGALHQSILAFPLDYYLCNNATVQQLTGHATMGMADLKGRAVISSHFPHFHELAHLLIYLREDQKTSLTLPIVQEGLACLLAGRWGRSSATVLYSGWVNQNFGMGQLEDALTYEGFWSFRGGADVAYPLGAMLCEIVRRQAGWPGVLELNQRVSGSVNFVRSLTESAILETVGAICQWPQGEEKARLDQAMAGAWPEYRRCGIQPVSSDQTAGPGIFTVKAQSYPIYLMSAPNAYIGATSSTFADHHPGKVYEGQRYGLRCSPEEIALYDYATNELLAIWVAGFTDESGACGSLEAGVVFQCTEEWIPVLESLIQ